MLSTNKKDSDTTDITETAILSADGQMTSVSDVITSGEAPVFALPPTSYSGGAATQKKKAVSPTISKTNAASDKAKKAEGKKTSPRKKTDDEKGHTPPVRSPAFSASQPTYTNAAQVRQSLLQTAERSSSPLTAFAAATSSAATPGLSVKVSPHLSARSNPNSPKAGNTAAMTTMLKKGERSPEPALPPYLIKATGLVVHVPLLEKGILAVAAPKVAAENLSEHKFTLGSRTLVIGADQKDFSDSDPSKTKRKQKEFEKLIIDHRKLLLNILNATHVPFPKAAAISAIALQLITEYSGYFSLHTSDPEDIIFNPTRRDEIFLPLTPKGPYVYPWLSRNAGQFQFTGGFDQFVTCGCIFGSSLLAEDQKENFFPVIKHYFDLFPTQQIQDVTGDDPAVYEEHALSTLTIYASFIQKHAKQNQPRKLLYHLPYYDYFMFGIELYLKNKITLSALDKFYRLLLDKRDELIDAILTICKSYNIDVVIHSPFEPLFESIADRIETERSNTESPSIASAVISRVCPPEVLAKLNSNREPGVGVEKSDIKAVAQYCLQALMLAATSDSKTNPNSSTATTAAHAETTTAAAMLKRQRQVWTDFAAFETDIKIDEKTGAQKIKISDAIKNIEDLLQIGNAVMHGVASYGKPNYSVCALNSLTEKQIATSYSTLTKANKASHKSYGAIVNLHEIDRTLVYTRENNKSNKGLVFYAGAAAPELLPALVRMRDDVPLPNNSRTNAAASVELQRLLTASPSPSAKNRRSFY